MYENSTGTRSVCRGEMSPWGLTICVLVILGILATGPVAPAALVVTVSLNGTTVLPCTYTGETTTMCWGRGRCPNSWCNNEIIRTDGRRVTGRKSDRYQLLGNISQGDVSLTITGATKEDEGTYCCRVEIPGLFNDKKIERTVKIRQAAPKPPEPTHKTVPTTHDHESLYVTPKATSADPTPSIVKRVSQDSKIEDTLMAGDAFPHIIGSVVIVLIILISLTALLFTYRYCKRKNNKSSSRIPAILSLEGLERTPDQTEQNIYMIN
ncbi:hepatitis A virus cellular receptor 2 homolog isoform X2 [Dendrobates tinctorius]|uniref:hepatitis A virus cellular receptor 2 homolog isoform X2 n=1 Tax=Dendrobates tinctorius TaxID=92724 RepID=UPI003CCA43FD